MLYIVVDGLCELRYCLYIIIMCMYIHTMFVVLGYECVQYK